MWSRSKSLFRFLSTSRLRTERHHGREVGLSAGRPDVLPSVCDGGELRRAVRLPRATDLGRSVTDISRQTIVT